MRHASGPGAGIASAGRREPAARPDHRAHRRRELPARTGAPMVGGPPADQRVRRDRDHRGRHPHRAADRHPGPDRHAHRAHPRLRAGRPTGTPRPGAGGRAVRRGRQRGTGISAPFGSDRHPLPRGSLRPARFADVPHRRCRPATPGRPAGVPAPRRRPGQDPWRSGGARRARSSAATAGRRRARGRRRTRRRPRGTAARRLCGAVPLRRDERCGVA